MNANNGEVVDLKGARELALQGAEVSRFFLHKQMEMIAECIGTIEKSQYMGEDFSIVSGKTEDGKKFSVCLNVEGSP